MLKDKKGVSPVVGVILMVAATIVIAAIVMGFLGGFKAPKKPLDIQLANGELILNKSNWTMTFTIAGSESNVLKNPSDLEVTVYPQNGNPVTLKNGTNNCTIKIEGSILVIKGNNSTLNNANLQDGSKVRVIIKYKPTGQILFDSVLIAREE